MSNQTIIKTSFLFTIAVLTMAIGRGWEHIFFDSPYREVLLDETIMTPVVNAILGISWAEYANNPIYDEIFQIWSVRVGWLYLFLGIIIAVSTIFYSKGKIVGLINGIACFLLTGLVLILSFLLFKKQFYHIGQLLENTLQVATPVFLYAYLKFGWSNRLENAIKVAIVLTFGCHGLYAMGYYPVPGDFVEMTINILNCSETTAKHFLKIIGVLDLLWSVCIFLPGKWKITALYYMVIWGFITAIARVWGHWHSGYEAEAINKYWFRMLYRMPHFLVPLALLFRVRIFQKSGKPGSP